MSDRIPVTFEHDGKTYSGYFSQVQGGGSTAVFHLMIDKFYWGRLRLSADNEWVFDPTPHDPWLADYAAEFGFLIISWFQ